MSFLAFLAAVIFFIFVFNLLWSGVKYYIDYRISNCLIKKYSIKQKGDKCFWICGKYLGKTLTPASLAREYEGKRIADTYPTQKKAEEVLKEFIETKLKENNEELVVEISTQEILHDLQMKRLNAQRARIDKAMAEISKSTETTSQPLSKETLTPRQKVVE